MAYNQPYYTPNMSNIWKAHPTPQGYSGPAETVKQEYQPMPLGAQPMPQGPQQGSFNGPTTAAEAAPQEAQNETTLIVNYLPQNMTDNEFRILFETVGKLKSCKICRQKPSGWSYGFGFVEYYSPQHAQTAIDRLNGHEVDSKRLKVALSRPGGEKTKGANLYIRNIPKTMQEAEFRQVFQPYGKIINCRLLLDKATGMSRGCGFVLYDKKSEADTAMGELSGTYLAGSTNGLIIRVADDNTAKVRPPTTFMPFAGGRLPNTGGPGPIRPPGNRFQSRFNPMGGGPIPQQPRPRVMPNFNPNINDATPLPGCTLYVYNIGNTADQGSIGGLFSQVGTVQKVDIMWDWEKQQGKGYGFVTMATPEEAQAAIRDLSGYMFTNKPLQVSLYTKKS